MVLAVPAKILLVQIPPTNTPLIQVFWTEEIFPVSTHYLIQAFLVEVSLVLFKNIFKIVIPKEFISPNKVVTHKNLILTYLPTNVLHEEKSELSTTCFTSYHLHYEKIPIIKKCAYNLLLFQPLSQLLF